MARFWGGRIELPYNYVEFCKCIVTFLSLFHTLPLFGIKEMNTNI